MNRKSVGIATVIMIFAACTCAAAGYMRPAEEGNVVHIDDSFPKETGAAVVYKNNETIWIPSGHQMIEEMTQASLDKRYANLNNHFVEDFDFTLRSHTWVYLMTPLTRPTGHNGKIPVMRNITFRLRMPVGVNITGVGVSGITKYLYEDHLVRRGTATDRNYLIDLGSRRALPEPIQVYLRIQNDLNVNATVYSYGAMFRQEW